MLHSAEITSRGVLVYAVPAGGTGWSIGTATAVCSPTCSSRLVVRDRTGR
ncbi:hypothetical protein [Pseudonocardia acidicola]|uniref:Uncharacterized protein n=1 Tax=Pseudonocardia acidicola TaxID=2724939 RepID=A0ABX1S962_9PSEU|nr:hypothetical protein [Pseudonocardia acidicola]NMH96886.1 hypothetical protein [Pseudonocardia acidicola]